MSIIRLSLIGVLATVLVATSIAPIRAASPAQGRRANQAQLAMLTEAMTLVARQVPIQTMDPQLDQFVQNVPPARRLGARWTPADPAFKRAKRVVLDRIDRLGVNWAKSGELGRAFEAEINRVGPDADKALASLSSPAGPLIVRQLAMINFTSGVMSDSPNGPKPGDPAYRELSRAIRTIFDLTIGQQLPKDDGRHTEEATEFLSTPNQRVLMSLCTVVVGKAVVQLQGAINLMIFDQRDAMAREIEAIISTVK